MYLKRYVPDIVIRLIWLISLGIFRKELRTLEYGLNAVSAIKKT
jgi:hypothetical protein